MEPQRFDETVRPKNRKKKEQEEEEKEEEEIFLVSEILRSN